MDMSPETRFMPDRGTTRVSEPLAFESLFEEKRARLFGAVCLVTGDRREAEEITQDAFLKLRERWDSCSPSSCEACGRRYRPFAPTWAGCGRSYTMRSAGCGPSYTTRPAGCGPSYTTRPAGCGRSYTTRPAGCGRSCTTRSAVC